MDLDKKEKIEKLLKEIKDSNHKKINVYALDGCPSCIEIPTALLQ